MNNMFTPKSGKSIEQREQHLRSLVYLCDVLAAIDCPVEAAGILRDLLSPQEMTMLANRLQIAVLLLDGVSYQEIRHTLNVSDSTISRVSNWLEVRGDSYRLLKARTKIRSVHAANKTKGRSRKSISAQYIWPSILISELVAVLTKDNAYQILDILAEAEQKPQLFRLLESHKEG